MIHVKEYFYDGFPVMQLDNGATILHLIAHNCQYNTWHIEIRILESKTGKMLFVAHNWQVHNNKQAFPYELFFLCQAIAMENRESQEKLITYFSQCIK